MMNILITGITGTIGTCLAKRLYGKHNIVGISHSEKSLVEFRQKYPSIHMILGDITDKSVISEAMNNIDGVFHLAAQKSIDISEINVKYCCNTNIFGTMNIVDESILRKPKFVLFISSDKARQIAGVYGCSKYIGERLIKEGERINPNTQYRTCVFGNVLYSTGSVLCKWKENMLNGNPITITDPDMTRFFWTDEQAVDFIFKTLNKAPDSSPYVPSMKSIRIGDLVTVMMKKYGKVDTNIIGIRNGESLHESLGNGIYSNDVERYSLEEIEKLI
jgi:UDP-N-acetylglucosamine 4,6-dehydratase/5-epimerase